MSDERLRLVALNTGRHIDFRVLGFAVLSRSRLGHVGNCCADCLGKDFPSTEIRNLCCLDLELSMRRFLNLSKVFMILLFYRQRVWCE
jgi:hypothetical protein